MNIERIIIVLACLIPIFALVIVLPKKIAKKESTKESKPEPSKEVKQEYVKEEPKKPETYSTDEFKDYLKNAKRNVNKPIKRTKLTEEEIDKMFSQIDNKKTGSDKENKPLAEEINDLSPELKALIISGALDKKRF